MSPGLEHKGQTVTQLERLIQAHTAATTTLTLSRATERVAEEMAREILKDPAFRAELHRLVRLHFSGTIDALATNGRKPTRKATRRGRK